MVSCPVAISELAVAPKALELESHAQEFFLRVWKRSDRAVFGGAAGQRLFGNGLPDSLNPRSEDS